MTKTEINASLLKAAEEGDVERLKALVAKGADVNHNDYVYGTALMQAAEKGNADCVQALVAAGADVNAQQDHYCRQTALMKAVEAGNADCVNALIAAGADMNKKDHVDRTAFEMAAEEGKVDCVKALIAAGADVNAKNKHGRTVLQNAHRSVKRILRAAGAKRKIPFKDIGIVVGIVLVWAALALGIAALMHRLSPSFPTWGARLLGIVSPLSIWFCVLLLVGDLGNSADRLVGDLGYSAYRKLLLFCWAVLPFGIAALMHWLSPWFPTWAAAGLFGVVAAPVICPLVLLLPEPLPSRGQVNARNAVGKTPLMEAAGNGDRRRVKALIRKGADVNAHQEGYSRTTALMYAAEKGSADCVKALIAAGADVNAKDHIGKTALMLYGYKSEIAAILEAASSPAPSPAPPAASKARIAATNTLENNLLRWKASGNPEKWVRQHNMKWNHQDWLDLLASLRQSEFWPMDEAAIGATLEATKTQTGEKEQRKTEEEAAARRRESPPGPEPCAGQVVGGCRLVRRIGEGGTGVVYQAHHLGLDITVAVKVLTAEVPGRDTEFLERFLREARTAARLKHPNIVGVLNVGSQEGIHFIVMEFIEGRSLQQILKDEIRLPIPTSVELISQVCQGLHYAHERGVIHRDIKPGNILVESTGVAKVADFGFAKIAEHDLSLTVTGAIMGTPYYLSPEQALDAKNVDRRTDIYSLGCTFYHAVCGKVPFQGETAAQILLAHQRSTVPDPRAVNPAVPDRIAQLIMKMMEKKPANRFDSASVVREKLGEFASELGRRN